MEIDKKINNYIQYWLYLKYSLAMWYVVCGMWKIIRHWAFLVKLLYCFIWIFCFDVFYTRYKSGIAKSIKLPQNHRNSFLIDFANFCKDLKMS
jgi:hypothetical protein